jgi:peptidoglycan-associated lipoprotein
MRLGPLDRERKLSVPHEVRYPPRDTLFPEEPTMLRTSLIVLAAALAVAATGCAKKPVAKDPNDTSLTGAKMNRGVKVSDELARLCKIQFENTDKAPKFDFDEAALLPEDRAVLEQVAKCVTEGPMKGRKLALVGRADPRGETMYNLALGEHRADSVRVYLAKLGVGEDKMVLTSRGELDAEGSDEETWKADRRVDIALN